MYKSLLLIISILLVLIGSILVAHAQITMTVWTTEQCLEEKGYVNHKDYEPIGVLSNEYDVYVIPNDMPCIMGAVNPIEKIVLLEKNSLTLEVLVHESVHLAQNDSRNIEDEAYGTTKYLFELMELLNIKNSF